MSPVTVRPYLCADEASLLDAWNASLPHDPIDASTFRRKVLLDPNFTRDRLLVAETDERIAGLCLCLVRRVPIEGGGLEPERGWITAFGVRPECRRQGVGSALLDRALELFREAGRREVLISPYTPNYFVPGVDVEHYAEGLAFLQKRGFEVIARPLSMDTNIVLFDYALWREREGRLREHGVEVRSLMPREMPLLLAYLREHTFADWLRDARELLTDVTRGLADIGQFTVAVREGEIVGYCQFRGEHFGPFGVRPDSQGQGIGSVLLAKCLLTMKGKGLHNAWVLWTSDETAERVYSRFGFRETRRFSVLKRRL